MAITAEQVQAAVEKFLPRTLEVSRDADTGALDQEKVVERALQIARTSMLMDIEAPFYPLSMAVTSWGEDLQSILDAMAKLASDDLLLSLRDEAPYFISDFTKLRSARTKLSQLSGSVAEGTLSDNYLDGFTGDLEDFVADEVMPNVTNRNRVVIRDEAKAVYAGLEPLWLDVLAKKDDLLAQVDAFLEVDLKSKVASELILAIRKQLAQTIKDLEGANSSEQAALAEQVLIDLAASRAVLKIIQTAPDYTGTKMVVPAIEGSTPKDYLQRQGKGVPEPISVVDLPSGARFGTGGRIHLDPLAGGHGEAVDDGDGDILTDTFRDSGAAFVVDGVKPDHFLFLVHTAQCYRILTVTATELTTTPEIPNDITSDDRYLVLEDMLGTYFKDTGESFWTEYSDGATGSNVVVSGGGGIFLTDRRLEDDDGSTNGLNSKKLRQSSVVTSDHALTGQKSGTKWPFKMKPVDGQLGGKPLGKSGVANAEAGTYPSTHDQFTSSGQSASNRWFDTNVADFTALGVSVGDLLEISGVSADAVYWRIDGIVSTWFTVDESARSMPALSGKNWKVKARCSNYVVYDSTATFVTDSVAIGDYVYLKSVDGDYRELFQVDSVISEDRIMLDSTIASYETDVFCIVYNGASVTDTSTIGPDYIYTAGSFFDALVQVGDVARVYTGGDAEGDYEITALISDNIVQIDGVFSGFEDSQVEVYFHPEDYTDLFYDPDGEFLTKGIVAGDKLYLHEGSGTGTPIGIGGEAHTISEVVGQNYLKVDTPFTEHSTQITWHISPDSTYFFNSQDVIVYAGLLKDTLAESPGYKLVITASAMSSHEGDYNLKYNPDDRNAYPEIGLYWLELDDSLPNDADNPAFYTGWHVSPQDDKTWLFAFSDSYGSKIDFLDFTDDNGDDNSVAGTITYDGSRDACYLVHDGNAYQVYFAVREDPYDSTSPAYTIRIKDRVDVLETPWQDWEIWRGLTTDVFTDTVNSPFGSSALGDIIRLDPNGPDQQDVIIIEVISASEVKVSAQLDAGQSGLSYAIFDTVKPGMELVTGSRRVQIVDIADEHVLKLRTSLPASVGKDLTWFVVLPGTNLDTTYLVDRDAAFLADGGFGTGSVPDDWVEGSTVHVMGSQMIKAKVVGVSDLDGDGIAEAVIIDKGMPLSKGPVSYKVLDFEEMKTVTFTPGDDTEGSPIDLSLVEAGDLLTVWGRSEVYEIEEVDAGAGTVELNPRISAGLTDQTFVITRNGAQAWGRFLLLRYLLEQLDLDEDLDDLKLHLAEVIADFGGEAKVEIVASPGGTATLEDDSDADDTTPTLHVTKEADIQAGDQVYMTLSDDGEVFSYVETVDHSDPTYSALTLYHEFESSQTVTTYSIVRNSVSYVLDEIFNESDGLYSQIEAIQDVATAFEVPANSETSAVTALFEQLSMDKAVDAIKAGDLEALSEMSAGDSSYSASAAVAVNTLGQSTALSGTSSGSSAASSNVAGENPDESTSSDYSGTNTSTTVPEEVEIRIALADLAEYLAAETRTYEAAEMGLDEALSRAIFELNGEVESDLITDTDPTLPWIAVSGSKKDRIIETKEAADAALDYMIENPDEFETVEGE